MKTNIKFTDILFKEEFTTSRKFVSYHRVRLENLADINGNIKIQDPEYIKFDYVPKAGSIWGKEGSYGTEIDDYQAQTVNIKQPKFYIFKCETDIDDFLIVGEQLFFSSGRDTDLGVSKQNKDSYILRQLKNFNIKVDDIDEVLEATSDGIEELVKLLQTRYKIGNNPKIKGILYSTDKTNKPGTSILYIKNFQDTKVTGIKLYTESEYRRPTSEVLTNLKKRVEAWKNKKIKDTVKSNIDIINKSHTLSDSNKSLTLSSKNSIVMPDNVRVRVDKSAVDGDGRLLFSYVPNSTVRFSAKNNNITTLERFPARLDVLNVVFNRLQNLSGDVTFAKEIDASHNSINTLKGMPDCTILKLDENDLTNLEGLSKKVTQLYVSNNKIVTLDAILDGEYELFDLDLSFNKLKKLKRLPKATRSLNLTGNVDIGQAFLDTIDFNIEVLNLPREILKSTSLKAKQQEIDSIRAELKDQVKDVYFPSSTI